MSKSPHYLNASTPYRVDWRPSRLAAVCVLALGCAAAWALWLSDIARVWVLPVALLVILRAAYLAYRGLRQPSRQLLWGIDGSALLDGIPIENARLHWRGALVFLHWREQGCLRSLVWWPDTLNHIQRRELHLRGGGADTSRLPPSVAT